MTTPIEIRLPTAEFRSLPIPGQSGHGKTSKVGFCYVQANDVPEELGDWLKVNPRMPTRKEKDHSLTGRVAKRIVETLDENPQIFALKNQGIYILADKVDFTKEQGGQGFVRIRLTDELRHGVVNGGHTYHSIRQVIEDPGMEDPETAYVQLHIMENIDPENITELAEGLNRSLQVTDHALANLEGKFEEIKTALAGKIGSDNISYAMGYPGDVDIQEVLFIMGMLNIKEFPNDKKHPNRIFGSPTRVLELFKNDMDIPEGKPEDYSAFRRMLPALHELLILHENIIAETAEPDKLGLLGKKKGKNVRATKEFPAIFTKGLKLKKHMAVGLTYPILAAFRVNIDQAEWAKGNFKWLVPPLELLSETIADLSQVVKNEYEENKQQPALVGKKQAAYDRCYSKLFMELVRKGKSVS